MSKKTSVKKQTNTNKKGSAKPKPKQNTKAKKQAPKKAAQKKSAPKAKAKNQNANKPKQTVKVKPKTKPKKQKVNTNQKQNQKKENVKPKEAPKPKAAAKPKQTAKVKETPKPNIKPEPKKVPNIKEEKILEVPLKDEVINNPLFKKDITLHEDREYNENIKVILIIIIAILLVSLALLFNVRNKAKNYNEKDYKYIATTVSYEDLVRNPGELKEKIVKVYGKVTNVKGVDVKSGNIMEITMDANLFDDELVYTVNLDYVDTDYKHGFIEGDLITVYGRYKRIDGNTPYLEAKYIEIGIAD